MDTFYQFFEGICQEVIAGVIVVFIVAWIRQQPLPEQKDLPDSDEHQKE